VVHAMLIEDQQEKLFSQRLELAVSSLGLHC
jgi:hypothetical protein